MANLSDQKTLQNRSAVLGPTIIHDQNLADLDPAVYEGSFAYSSDKRMYFSNGSVWRTTEDPVVKTPNGSVPNSTTTQRQLRLSQFALSSAEKPPKYTQIGMVFEVATDRAMKKIIMRKSVDSTTGSSYNLIATDTNPNLKPGDVFFWHGKYLATDGQESGFSAVLEQTFPDYIDAPVPIAGTGVGETSSFVQVSPYVSPFSIENLYPPSQIEWLISLDNFKTSFSPIKLDYLAGNPFDTFNFVRTAGTVYYWKARYWSTTASGLKYSAYSPVGTNKQVKDILTPAVIPPVIPDKNLTLKLTPYVSVSKKPRLRTEWLIADSISNLDIDGVPLKVVNNSDSLDIVTLDSSILADGNTVYYWKARYVNSISNNLILESDYSPGTKFIRYPEFANPTITTTKNAETSTLTISAFTSEYSTIYPYAATEWEVYNITSQNVAITTGTLLVSAYISSNTFNIFGYSQSTIPPGTNIRWRARQKNSRGAYTSWIESTNYQVPWITTPTANSTGNTTSLVSSQYESLFNVIPKYSEITITGGALTNPIIILTTGDITNINNFQNLAGFSPDLVQGQTYYWKVRYFGQTARATEVSSSYSNVRSYVQPDIIKTPVINYPSSQAINAGPDLTFTSSALDWYTVPIIGALGRPEHLYSDWELSLTPSFNPNTDIVDSVYNSTKNLTSWRTTKLKAGATYYLRVKYYTNRGQSLWSTGTFTFSTPAKYDHSLKYTPKPRTITKEYPDAGGYYAGNMWHYATTSDTPYIVGGNSTILLSGSTIDFIVPNMQYYPLFYIGQKIQLRSSTTPANIKIDAVVKYASADVLTVVISSIYKYTTIPNGTTVNSWFIMSLYRIILSYKSRGEIRGTDAIIRTTVVSIEGANFADSGNAKGWQTQPLNTIDIRVLQTARAEDPYFDTVLQSSQQYLTWPTEYLNLSDGSLIQKAMWRHSWFIYAISQVTPAVGASIASVPITSANDRANPKYLPENLYPLAHKVYNFNKNSPNNLGFSDWYAPSRDELELCFRTFTPTEYTSSTPAPVSTTRGLYYYSGASNTGIVAYNRKNNTNNPVLGNISDVYSTDLANSATVRTNYGSNSNCDPVQHSYFYTFNSFNTKNQDLGYNYLHLPLTSGVYITPFLMSTLPNFAITGTETLYNPPYTTMVSTSSSDAITTNDEKAYAPFTMNISADKSYFGKQGVDKWAGDSTSFTRLIRRELA
jgi:hypothetical protein